MITFPNGKINIGLYITGKRDDGYHNLETVFYPVPVKDALEIVPATGEPQVHLSGLPVQGDPMNNLVWKAYILLKARYRQRIPDLDVYLHKAIPMGAGLGGGSADGAFMLRLISDYCQLALAEEELLDLALQLGSDCPFFIRNTPQFATGRGEIMEPLDLKLKGYQLLLICPGIHVSTAAAFSDIQPQAARTDLRQIDRIPVSEWRHKVGNDFEEPVFRQFPELKEIKEKLYRAGALYAQMSGTGSAMYGIFETDPEIDLFPDRNFSKYQFSFT